MRAAETSIERGEAIEIEGQTDRHKDVRFVHDS